MTDWERLLEFLEANMDVLNINAIERKLGLGTGTLRKSIVEKRRSQYAEKILAFFSAFNIQLNNVYD